MKINNFSYSVGKQLLFDDISVTLTDGAVNLLVGRNGIGKTVLLDLISDLNDDRPENFVGFPVKQDIIYQTQGVPFMTDATIKETVRMILDIAGLSQSGELDMPNEIKQNWDKRFGDLSGGERRLVTIWTTSIIPRKLYIFDEPLANLDPNMAHKVMDILYQLANAGKTVILSTHQYADVKVTHTQMIYLKDRRVQYQGLVAEYLAENGVDSLQEQFRDGI